MYKSIFAETTKTRTMQVEQAVHTKQICTMAKPGPFQIHGKVALKQKVAESKIDHVGRSFIAFLPPCKTNVSRWQEQSFFRKGICLAVFLSGFYTIYKKGNLTL